MTFEEMFIESSHRPIAVDGALVHHSLVFPVPEPCDFSVRFVSAVRRPAQGLRLRVAAEGGGTIAVAGQSLDNVVLWQDTSPKNVHLSFVPSSPSARLRLWNCWRDGRGVAHAWEMNGGIQITNARDGELEIDCNSGFEKTFGDLVVRISGLPRPDGYSG